MGRLKGIPYTEREKTKRRLTKERKTQTYIVRARQVAETRHINRCLAENLAAFKAEERRRKLGLPPIADEPAYNSVLAIGGTD